MSEELILKQVFFIEFNRVLNEKSFVFIIKRFFFVVLLLLFDVVDDFVFFTNGISKSSVAFLLSFKIREKATLFHPNTTSDFDVFYKI